MSSRVKPLIALLGLAALLAAPASASAPKTTPQVEPATRTASFTLPGTNGWKLQFSAVANGHRRKQHTIGVEAIGPDDETVSYSVHGRFAPDGTIDAKLPGIGRIAVHFDPTSEHTLHVSHPKHCTGRSTATDPSGVFRGRIEFHGEGGFTEVERQSARGRLGEFPRQVCKVRKHHTKVGKAGGDPLRGIDTLYATRRLDGGTLTFNATSWPAGALLPGEPASVQFTANYGRSRHGMSTFATVSVAGKTGDFAVTAAGGTPSEATVDPPAPFKGSAVFRLESPKVASWTGDLSVELPTLGVVDLTEPSFGSILCEATTCTETAPPGDNFQFFTIVGSTSE